MERTESDTQNPSSPLSSLHAEEKDFEKIDSPESEGRTHQGQPADGGESGLTRPNSRDQLDFFHRHLRRVRSHVRKDPPQSVPFFHNALHHVRLHVVRLWVQTVLFVSICIIGILSIYWGSLFRVTENLHNLSVIVVDFDARVAPYDTGSVTPLVGPMVTEITEQVARSTHPHLGFETKDPAEYGNDPYEVRRAVYDFDAWAAIIVNANATTFLQEAIQSGNVSYDPTGAAQVIYVQARQETTHASYIEPMLTQLQTEITARFGEEWTQRVLQNSSIPRDMLARVPQALSPAIGFTTINLRPFTLAVVTPAVSIGLIYLIIIAFFSFTFFLPIHMKYMIPKGHPPLHFHHLILWRWVSTMGAYFLMSLCYSLISLAFQVPFSNGPASPVEPAAHPSAYGSGTFPVYWMLNFVGMAALGLACENMAMFLGMPWTAMWLIFWVITNVATAFNPIELLPGFYQWGFAWPLHNIVEASRQIIFNLHSRIGLNFGILFAWCAVNTMLFPFACYFMRWKQMRAQKQSEQQRKER